jgi:hypothetical protein
VGSRSVLKGIGNFIVLYSGCIILNIVRVKGNGMLLNSASATVSAGLFMRYVNVTSVSVPKADAGGLFYVLKCTEIFMFTLQGLGGFLLWLFHGSLDFFLLEM